MRSTGNLMIAAALLTLCLQCGCVMNRQSHSEKPEYTVTNTVGCNTGLFAGLYRQVTKKREVYVLRLTPEGSYELLRFVDIHRTETLSAGRWSAESQMRIMLRDSSTHSAYTLKVCHDKLTGTVKGTKLSMSKEYL